LGRIRIEASQNTQRTPPLSDHRSNGDEERYANKIASYSKGLSHNQLGEVDLTAYRALLLPLLVAG
jgi:hypothetical protein